MPEFKKIIIFLKKSIHMFYFFLSSHDFHTSSIFFPISYFLLNPIKFILCARPSHSVKKPQKHRSFSNDFFSLKKLKNHPRTPERRVLNTLMTLFMIYFFNSVQINMSFKLIFTISSKKIVFEKDRCF